MMENGSLEKLNGTGELLPHACMAMDWDSVHLLFEGIPRLSIFFCTAKTSTCPEYFGSLHCVCSSAESSPSVAIAIPQQLVVHIGYMHRRQYMEVPRSNTRICRDWEGMIRLASKATVVWDVKIWRFHGNGGSTITVIVMGFHQLLEN